MHFGGVLEARQSQAEVAGWLQASYMEISRLWLQLQATGTITKRIGQGRPRVRTPSDDR